MAAPHAVILMDGETEGGYGSITFDSAAVDVFHRLLLSALLLQGAFVCVYNLAL